MLYQSDRLQLSALSSISLKSSIYTCDSEQIIENHAFSRQAMHSREKVASVGRSLSDFCALGCM